MLAVRLGVLALYLHPACVVLKIKYVFLFLYLRGNHEFCSFLFVHCPAFLLQLFDDDVVEVVLDELALDHLTVNEEGLTHASTLLGEARGDAGTDRGEAPLVMVR